MQAPPRRTCQVPGVLLPRAVHLALATRQHLLHQVQHAEVLHDVVEEDGILKGRAHTENGLPQRRSSPDTRREPGRPMAPARPSSATRCSATAQWGPAPTTRLHPRGAAGWDRAPQHPCPCPEQEGARRAVPTDARKTLSPSPRSCRGGSWTRCCRPFMVSISSWWNSCMTSSSRPASLSPRQKENVSSVGGGEAQRAGRTHRAGTAGFLPQAGAEGCRGPGVRRT